MKKEMFLSITFILLLFSMPFIFAESYSGETEINFDTDDDKKDYVANDNISEEGMNMQQKIILWTIIVIILLVILSYKIKKNKINKKINKKKKK